MATNLKSALLLTVLTFVLTPDGIAQAKARIKMAEARTVALAAENGKIKSEEFEKEKGKQIYSFDIQMPNGLHEVNVDAATGKVIEDTIESAEDEAKEAAQDKAASEKRNTAKKLPASDAHPQ